MSFLEQPPTSTDESTAPAPEPTSESGFDTSGAPEIPHPAPGASPDEVKQMLADFIEQQKSWRSAALKEIRTARAITAPPVASEVESLDQRTRARQAEIAAHPYYCSVCGRLHDYLRECVGPQGANHPPVIVTSTDELKGAPDPVDKQAYAEWQGGHTAAPDHEELLAALR